MSIPLEVDNYGMKITQERLGLLKLSLDHLNFEMYMDSKFQNIEMNLPFSEHSERIDGLCGKYWIGFLVL